MWAPGHMHAIVAPSPTCSGVPKRMYRPWMWASSQAEAAGELHLLLLPLATGGRSLSPCTVFLPTCSPPPMSRKKAIPMTTTAPSRAPSCPLVIIADLRRSVPIGQRLCRIEVPRTRAHALTPQRQHQTPSARLRADGPGARLWRGTALAPAVTILRWRCQVSKDILLPGGLLPATAKVAGRRLPRRQE
jgi:hypothetical protein